MFAVTSDPLDSASQTSGAARHAQLAHAAQQFEAVMLSELMKPLSSGSAIGEDNDESSSNAMQTYGVEAMAGALAKSGALGFAAKMVSSVEAHEGKDSSEKISPGANAGLDRADNPERGYQR